VDTLLKQKEPVKKTYLQLEVRLADVSDEALVDLTKEGSEAAFTEIIRRYMEKSCLIAYQVVGDFEAARDLSQDVFVKIYTSIHKFEKTSRFFSWFYRILLNHCINYSTRKKRVNFIPFSEIFLRPGETPDKNVFDKENELEISERHKVVRAAIERLSSKHKNVIILCYMEDFSQEEAAEILGVAIGTVRSRLHYARENLKKLLKDIYV